MLEFAKLHKDKHLLAIFNYYEKEFSKKHSKDTNANFVHRGKLYVDLANFVDVFDKPIERDTQLIALYKKYNLTPEV